MRSFVPPLLIFLFQNAYAYLPTRVLSKPTVLFAGKGAGASLLPDLSQPEFPAIPESGYDLVVIGSGPGGEAVAVLSAQLGAKVAVIEKRSAFGGPTGLTSKAVREATKRICRAVDQVGGDRRRQIQNLWRKRFPILKTEAEVLQAAESRDKLRANGCDLFIGSPELVRDSQGKIMVQVKRPTCEVMIPTKHVCIATGSRSHRPVELRPGVPLPFTKKRVVDSTEMGSMSQVPKAASVIGGGVIAVEYATVLAELGAGVSLLCPEASFLPFLEQELRTALRQYMTRGRILLENDPVDSIRCSDGKDHRVEVTLASTGPTRSGRRMKRRLLVDMVLFSGGRDANSDNLGCEKVGVEIGRFGRINVDRNMCTSVSNVYAVGDVTGPPGLASAAQQRGRQVAQHLFDKSPSSSSSPSYELDEFDYTETDGDNFFLTPEKDDQSERVVIPRDAPLTLWTIPEVSSVGISAAEARARVSEEYHKNVVEGYAYFKDTARGRLSGDPHGFLKIVARADSPQQHTILGVHIIGEGANELIQLGSVLVCSAATAEQVSNTPFAAVTMSGLYQVACDDILLKSPKSQRSRV